MIRLIKILSVLLFLATSCKKENKNVETSSISETQSVSLIDTIPLQFNSNDKWIANAETHEGVKRMDSIINVFNNEKMKDYKTLGDHLSKQTSYIIKNCTMKGEPHDQLHVVLVPMLDEISNLREHINIKESMVALNRLEQLIQAYFKYFKV